MTNRDVTLPDCEEVFARFFGPWYREDAIDRRGYKGTRPDAEGWCDPDIPASDASPIAEEGQQRIVQQIQTVVDAATVDWPRYLDVTGSPDINWVHAFDQHYDANAVAVAIAKSDPNEFSNECLVLCGEFGAVIGHAMRRMAPQLEWLCDWPYWESGLLDTRSGYRINVFHWAIKKFSDYGIDDGYRAKMLACLGLVKNGWED